ncbi:hypothetical protein TRFO_43158 [Tritrichomonas foetus]|uniref:Uncharacterized protein n=1 Tax=Tritrichomonas foetus TaxID=1144522 RepID=A0A1J4KWU3_9EUKA|nr:hypothetical protein TRFO_43158 [Tritrichomonas foetus]|eukprot:OHT14180.1 hypothetical protein TRFO_43158 [Tritrichomonas foetus]
MKHPRKESQWRQITVLDMKGEPYKTFNLTSMGKLSQKFPKHRPRNLEYEIENITTGKKHCKDEEHSSKRNNNKKSKNLFILPILGSAPSKILNKEDSPSEINSYSEIMTITYVQESIKSNQQQISIETKNYEPEIVPGDVMDFDPSLLDSDPIDFTDEETYFFSFI